MIQIKDKYQESTIKIPKNADYSGEFVFRVYSPVSQTIDDYDVEDNGTSRNFYVFSIDFSNLPDGEFNWTLIQDEDTVATGILQVGDGEETVQIVQYGAEIEYKQYYPKKPSRISIIAPEDIPYTATTLDFTIASNTSWACTIYKGPSMYGDTIRGNGKQDISVSIEPNLTKVNLFFDIAAGTDDETVTAEERVMQWGIPFSVSVSADTPIPASATSIPFTVTYDEYNSYRTGDAYLYKDGALSQQFHFGSYPYGFSSAFTIEENTQYETVDYGIEIILPATPNAKAVSASCQVVQEAKESPITKRFTIEMLEDGNINWEGRGYEYYDIIRNGVRDEGNQLDHSIDNLKAGDIVEFYLMTDNTNPINTHITSTAKHNVYGNIMSLSYVDFEDASACTTRHQFWRLFEHDKGLVSAADLILPEILSDGCFESMFAGCSSLVAAPELPAPILAEGCYANMFVVCTSLVDAPELPSLVLAPACYSLMFDRCSSLVTAPKLPATTLANACYYGMFSECSSLVNAPELPSVSPVHQCYSGMFYGCTSLTTAPVLPAYNMVSECYEGMFKYCSSLNYIKCTASHNVGVDNSLLGWVEGVSPSGTFVKKDVFGWNVGVDGIPEGWTVKNIE